MTLIEEIDDLIVQATKERSHYYVKKILVKCKKEIERLKEYEWKYNELCK